MKHLILPLFALILSCTPCRYVSRHPECFAPDTIVSTITQTVRDSVTYLVPDTSLISMVFECDSMNNVLMSQLDEYKTTGLVTKVVYKDNKLRIATYTDSIAVLNKIISNLKTKVTYVKNPVNDELKRQNIKLENKVHNRRWFMWYFYVSIGLAVLWVVVKVKFKVL